MACIIRFLSSKLYMHRLEQTSVALPQPRKIFLRMAEVNFLAGMKMCKSLPVIHKTMPRGTKLTWGHDKKLLCFFFGLKRSPFAPVASHSE